MVEKMIGEAKFTRLSMAIHKKVDELADAAQKKGRWIKHLVFGLN